jgi:hypothetical protein
MACRKVEIHCASSCITRAVQQHQLQARRAAPVSSPAARSSASPFRHTAQISCTLRAMRPMPTQIAPPTRLSSSIRRVSSATGVCKLAMKAICCRSDETLERVRREARRTARARHRPLSQRDAPIIAYQSDLVGQLRGGFG